MFVQTIPDALARNLATRAKESFIEYNLQHLLKSLVYFADAEQDEYRIFFCLAHGMR
ncbi:MAG: hypothetical protein G01um101466_573 [Parcubacteria group bacterium Gr01-1014_66]|nr:MAG: hypothetical protein G01um101466_573 [Parcubacteria group bacterium Gr01-1014_66]